MSFFQAKIVGGAVDCWVLLDAATAAPSGWVNIPPAEVSGLRVGATWDAVAGTLTQPPPDPRLKWLDPGPFKDRLDLIDGAPAKAIIYNSTHPAAKAVVADLVGRIYVDLSDGKVAAGLQALIDAGVPNCTLALKAAVLNTPTTEAERHIKGLQP